MRGLVLFAGLAASAVAAGQDTVVLGKLGQAVQSAQITSKPGSGRKYYSVKAYEYLVLRTGPSGYYKVLLQNGAEGYVPSKAVARLPYDVTQNKPAPTQRASALASRGGSSALGSPNTRAAAAEYSLNFKGTPYKWGGDDPLRGIDCSGFVKFLYGRIGVDLPRTAAEQVKVGRAISRLEDLEAGDRLYFWDSKRGKVGHTGIYLGSGYFCHSSTTNGGVATDYLGSKKWLKMLVAARR